MQSLAHQVLIPEPAWNVESAAGQITTAVGPDLTFFEKVECILASNVMKLCAAGCFYREHCLFLTVELKKKILKDPFMRSRYAPKCGSAAFQKLSSIRPSHT
ncbi:hypothetical protein N7495_009200 [Penicillium taxi]|uniref:uncharacterized protein n=1 Tax=Penicillium taxi TaxID=168475 RepID=UPI0025455838|nr:uncharacterized protein N7495_009200 [Penicillium taxi]KAJ5884690.1 hypothetical protein N7495_009200 [Penicillium taxi]